MYAVGINVVVAKSRTQARQVDAELVEAFLHASRALVAVAARSLAVGDAEITLPQHRTLVVLASRGPQRMTDIAELLAVNSSTATRHCDRLQRRGLVQRIRATDDRRAVRVSLTDAGRRLVEQISQARCQEISRILQTMPASSRQPLLSALRGFASAAGEVPEQNWSLGWSATPTAQPSSASPGQRPCS
jgi:DNA-binding MarR family transcriptional regulator